MGGDYLVLCITVQLTRADSSVRMGHRRIKGLYHQRGHLDHRCITRAGRGRVAIVAIAAIAAGLAQGRVDECLSHVGERAAFEHRLGYYQGLQFKIADTEARAYGARSRS